MYPSLLAPDRPDWRWARVAELSEMSATQAVARLQSEDEPTRLLYRFKQALDRGMPDRDDPFYAAHTVYLNQPEIRYIIEGCLLGGAPDEFICQLIHGQPSVIQAFHDSFFAVRPYLQSPGWIAATVFQGEPHSVHRGDRRGIRLRASWICGHEIFAQMQRSRYSPEERLQLRERVKDIFYSQLTEFALSAPFNAEGTPEWIKVIFGEGADEGGGSDGDYGDCVSAFLDGLGITVADPTDKRNLSLPAREPRTVQYEVVHA